MGGPNRVKMAAGVPIEQQILGGRMESSGKPSEPKIAPNWKSERSPAPSERDQRITRLRREIEDLQSQEFLLAEWPHRSGVPEQLAACRASLQEKTRQLEELTQNAVLGARASAFPSRDETKIESVPLTLEREIQQLNNELLDLESEKTGLKMSLEDVDDTETRVRLRECRKEIKQKKARLKELESLRGHDSDSEHSDSEGQKMGSIVRRVFNNRRSFTEDGPVQPAVAKKGWYPGKLFVEFFGIGNN